VLGTELMEVMELAEFGWRKSMGWAYDGGVVRGWVFSWVRTVSFFCRVSVYEFKASIF